jgi:DNA gyrase subunit B
MIDRGHLYIAQPPLYKVKANRTEVYLKNEGALEDFIISNAVDNLRLSIGDHFVTPEVLGEIARQGLRYRQLTESVAREHRAPVLEHLVDALQHGAIKPAEVFLKPDALQELADNLVATVGPRMPLARLKAELVDDKTDGARKAIKLQVYADGVAQYEHLDQAPRRPR